MIRVKTKSDAAGQHTVELYAHLDGKVCHAQVVTADADLAHAVARTFGLIGAGKFDLADPGEPT